MPPPPLPCTRCSPFMLVTLPFCAARCHHFLAVHSLPHFSPPAPMIRHEVGVSWGRVTTRVGKGGRTSASLHPFDPVPVCMNGQRWLIVLTSIPHLSVNGDWDLYIFLRAISQRREKECGVESWEHVRTSCSCTTWTWRCVKWRG